ncbi:MAG: major facilitator superfamily 1 [Friedmanniella sp.]|nr:major facilitator superfamily 1 [Friedmanniella sp.]
MTAGSEPTTSDPAGSADTGGWSPWRAVVGFGVVSLAADMVYEGARSVTGPLLAALGATGVVVGLVTGAGEALALVLRLAFGSLADRTGRYWTLTMTGYLLTAVCVPALALTPFAGGAGLVLACALVLAERTGKAVRSPAKSALLARAASQVGLGRGFAVHKALDQVGAVAGPLLVAAIAALSGALWPAFAALAVPAAVSILLLVWIRRHLGDGSEEPDLGAPRAPRPAPGARPPRARPALPRRFWWFAASSGAATAGLVTFGVISYHLTKASVVGVAAVPVVYAVAMAAAALAAVVTGWAFDRVHGRVLYALPVLVAAVPPLAFSERALVAVAGVVVWGAAVGVQDSTVKALVAALVPARRRATAYGWVAAVQGAAAVAGGTVSGALYDRSLPLLVALVAGTQVVALVLLVLTLRTEEPEEPAAPADPEPR